MVRLVALVVAGVAVMFVSASPAFAQSFKSTSSHTQPPAAKLDLSAKAAGLELLDSETPSSRNAGKPAVRPANSPQGTAKKSFWKSPWPYVILGAVVVVAVVLTSGGYGTPGGY